MGRFGEDPIHKTGIDPNPGPACTIDSVSGSLSGFVRKVSADGSPCFVLLALNGQIIARSEIHPSAGAMENGISAVMRHAAATMPAIDGS